MIMPQNVKTEANKREAENMKFRSYLKSHADESKLDKQFLRLHNELFKDYDCKKCRNCCTMYQGSIPEEDIADAAKQLNISQEQFIDFFLQREAEFGDYLTKHQPCDFLDHDGECKLGECKPDNCKNYPYTNQPERLESLYSILNVVAVCPVAFEIYERLKIEYGFRTRR